MVNITQISSTDISTQIEYNPQDEALISSFEVDTKLDSTSRIEYNIYDLNSNLLYNTYNYTSYNIKDDGQSSQNGDITQIIINPETDLEDIGFDQGEYNVYYNILSYKIGSNLETLYISEISSDRTELRLDSNNIDDVTFQEQANSLITERENSEYFLDFYINFGENNLVIANNILLINDDPSNPTILIKLYEPLPELYDIKSEMWVATAIDEPLAYNVEFVEEPIIFEDSTPLKGANFNLDIKSQVNNSTLNLSYSDIVSTSLTSSQNQLSSLLEEKELSINIDYTDFSNFIHFSSAQTRLENFYYKASLLEQYSSSISIINSNITGSTSSSFAVNESKTILENKISSIITNFDHYEYVLYYESSSYAWPKINTEPPYQLATTGSTEILNWFGSTNEDSPLYGGIILSASAYDDSNKDNLLYSIPEYLREDPENEPYELFISMVAQHYDNIWIYIKDVTQKFNSDNRLNFGVSKDLVADTIRDFGVKLYQNNFSNDDIFTAFLGLTPEGSLFPFPNITGSLPTPSGYEYIDTLISASNDYIPLDDVNKSLYKRIYHNLPYLLKAKGTIPGLRALITSYGIPDTILRISEFGGKDKVNENDWDYYYNKFNYKFDTLGSTYIDTQWDTNDSWNGPDTKPSSIEFRFKAEEFPPSNLSQSLLSFNQGGTSIAGLSLQYTGSGLTSGSYSGSIKDPYYQYANLTFYPSSSDLTVSASVYLPFFDEGWWSIMINSGSNGYELFAKNKIYNGNTGTSLGFQASSSITSTYDGWDEATNLYFGSGSIHSNFSGSYQEIRYYKNSLSESIFNDYVMNPLSIEGNNINSSPNELIFRAALGSELDTTSTTSIHPKVTGSWISTSSFTSNSDFTFNTTPTYTSNTEYYFLDQPAVGIKNRITDKIRIENNVLPEGNVLSPFQSLAQTQTNVSASYTPNINLLEVAFSPQNEINDDIISQLGYFNIGEYIGDPSFRTNPSDTYPNLDILRDAYFEKYIKNYNLFDFIRLIKYFDNSLFKMIKDFIPARTSLASGIVIKQHLLERNRYKNVLVDTNTTTAKYGKSGSISWNEPLTFKNIALSGTVKPQWNDYEDGKIVNTSGSTAGSFNTFNSINTSPNGPNGTGPENIFNITQSWVETYPTLSGSATVLHDSQDEFYNGEFSGSTIIATTQDLNSDCDDFKKVNATAIGFNGIRMYSGSFTYFISADNHPTDGYISIWYKNEGVEIPPRR
jgi:hypothetical protein